MLAPGLLNPEADDAQVYTADECIVALHRGDDGAVGQVPVFHFALNGEVLLRVRKGLECLAVGNGDHRNQSGIGVVAGSFYSLVILNDNSLDVMLGRLGEHLIRTHVVEGRNHNPVSVISLLLLTVFDEGIEIE